MLAHSMTLPRDLESNLPVSPPPALPAPPSFGTVKPSLITSKPGPRKQFGTFGTAPRGEGARRPAVRMQPGEGAANKKRRAPKRRKGRRRRREGEEVAEATPTIEVERHGREAPWAVASPRDREGDESSESAEDPDEAELRARVRALRAERGRIELQRQEEGGRPADKVRRPKRRAHAHAGGSVGEGDDDDDDEGWVAMYGGGIVSPLSPLSPRSPASSQGPAQSPRSPRSGSRGWALVRRIFLKAAPRRETPSIFESLQRMRRDNQRSLAAVEQTYRRARERAAVAHATIVCDKAGDALSAASLSVSEESREQQPPAESFNAWTSSPPSSPRARLRGTLAVAASAAAAAAPATTAAAAAAARATAAASGTNPIRTVTLPKPFSFVEAPAPAARPAMTISKRKFLEEMERKRAEEERLANYRWRANPIPPSTLEPRYAQLVERRKARSEEIRAKSKEMTLASQRPFHFAERRGAKKNATSSTRPGTAAASGRTVDRTGDGARAARRPASAGSGSGSGSGEYTLRWEPTNSFSPAASLPEAVTVSTPSGISRKESGSSEEQRQQQQLQQQQPTLVGPKLRLRWAEAAMLAGEAVAGDMADLVDDLDDAGDDNETVFTNLPSPQAALESDLESNASAQTGAAAPQQGAQSHALFRGVSHSNLAGEAARREHIRREAAAKLGRARAPAGVERRAREQAERKRREQEERERDPNWYLKKIGVDVGRSFARPVPDFRRQQEQFAEQLEARKAKAKAALAATKPKAFKLSEFRRSKEEAAPAPVPAPRPKTAPQRRRRPAPPAVAATPAPAKLTKSAALAQEAVRRRMAEKDAEKKRAAAEAKERRRREKKLGRQMRRRSRAAAAAAAPGDLQEHAPPAAVDEAAPGHKKPRVTLMQRHEEQKQRVEARRGALLAIKASLDEAGVKDYAKYFDPQELDDLDLEF